MRTRIFAAVMLALLITPGIAPFAPFALAASPSGTVFVPLSAIWGTSSSPVEAAPGSQNVLLTVSTAYTGGTTATSILATLRLPAGITDVYGNAAPTAGTTGVTSNSIFTLTYNLNIATSVETGTYSVPIQFSYTTTASGNNAVYAETDNTIINVRGTVTLEFTASVTSLNSGEVNTITVTLTNTGSGSATQVTPIVSTSAPSGGGVTVQTSSSGAGVSILNSLPAIASLAAGQSLPMNVSVYVPASVAGSSVALYFSATYSDPYGLSKTASQAVGFYAVSVPVPLLNFGTQVQSVVPGGVNEIPITLSNLGPGAVTRISTTIMVPSQFSVLNQFPTISRLNANASFTENLRLFVPASAAGTSAPLTATATFIDAYGTLRTTTQTLGLYALSSTDVNANTSISISALNSSLTAGQISPVSFLVRNTGTLPLHSPAFTLTVSAPLVVTSNSTVSLPSSIIGPGQSVKYEAMILSSVGATGGSYPGTLTVDYTDDFGNALAQSFNVGFALVSPVTQVSVQSLSSNVYVGNTTAVSYLIRNTGTAALYSPVLSLTTPSPLAVTANSTFTRPGLVLMPGQQMKYDAQIANGPKTPEGAYVSTLSLTYTDQFGNPHTSTFPVGLVVVGGIELVVQDQTTTQSAGSVTITGTLLNEGAASAFYMEMVANLTGATKLGSGSSYVGEVDPNTPLPFSITVTTPSLASQQTARVLLSAKYQNDFGQALRSDLPTSSVTLAPEGQAGQQGRAGGGTNAGQDAALIAAARLAVIAAILIAVVASAVYLRRAKRKSGEAKTTGAEKMKDSKVF